MQGGCREIVIIPAGSAGSAGAMDGHKRSHGKKSPRKGKRGSTRKSPTAAKRASSLKKAVKAKKAISKASPVKRRSPKRARKSPTRKVTRK